MKETRGAGFFKFDTEPGLTVLRNAAGKTFDVVSGVCGADQKFIVRASKRGYVRAYIGGRVRVKSWTGNPDVVADLRGKRITYKSGFEDLAYRLQSAYAELDDVKDEKRGLECSLRFFSIEEM